MTEMTVGSKILTKIIELVVRRILRKKLGQGAEIDIQSIKVAMNDGLTTINFSGGITMPTKDILKLVEKEETK